jgi:hypothetical protein
VVVADVSIPHALAPGSYRSFIETGAPPLRPVANAAWLTNAVRTRRMITGPEHGAHLLHAEKRFT